MIEDDRGSQIANNKKMREECIAFKFIVLDDDDILYLTKVT